ncbi:MAG TPA: potassium channel protein [Pyrinomonadaceae bacterium]|nr:potassium channel protein [Pyrinomonadaceae bacterium]
MSLIPTGTRSLPRIRRRIFIPAIAVGSALAMGAVGFHLIEGWSLLDSLYVAAQTVTTVGYGDLSPATRGGRVFASLFMLVAVGVVLYALTNTVQTIVQSELVEQFGQRRQYRKMSRLGNHYIVCGAGRVGAHLVRALLATNETFIVIERDPVRVAELTELGVLVLVRDATLEESLREAGVDRAKGLAACLPDDADNVYVVLSARDFNPNLHIVARAAAEQAESKLIRAGANRVVAPTIIGGHRMAMALTKPAVEDFIGSITANKLELAFEQLEVEPSSQLVGQKLSETSIRSELDIVVVSIRRSDGTILFNPSGEAVIQSADILIAIGHAESLMKLSAMTKDGGNAQSPRSTVQSHS